jgi:hypothetical protein
MISGATGEASPDFGRCAHNDTGLESAVLGEILLRLLIGEGYTPWAIRMNIKGKRLGKKEFVRI